MSRDPQLLISIQLAFIGIIMVVGFFYLWRSISRVERKIEEMSCQMINTMSKGCTTQIPLCNENKQIEKYEKEIEQEQDEDEEDYSIIQNCFGNMPITTLMDDVSASFMIFNTAHVDADDSEEKQGPIINDISEIKKEETSHSIKTIQDDVSSVSAAESNILSKNSLKKMTIISLKELCSSRGLSTDGSKTELIDRVLASIPTA